MSRLPVAIWHPPGESIYFFFFFFFFFFSSPSSFSRADSRSEREEEEEEEEEEMLENKIISERARNDGKEDLEWMEKNIK